MARGARVSTREASLPGPYRILASQVCMSLLRKAISERMLSSPNPTNQRGKPPRTLPHPCFASLHVLASQGHIREDVILPEPYQRTCGASTFREGGPSLRLTPHKTVANLPILALYCTFNFIISKVLSFTIFILHRRYPNINWCKISATQASLTFCTSFTIYLCCSRAHTKYKL